MNLTLISPPTEYLLTLTEAKEHLGIIDDDSQDDRITNLLKGITAHIERDTGLLFNFQIWEVTLPRWSSIKLPKEPVLEVTVDYLDPEGVLQELDPTLYHLKNYPSSHLIISSHLPLIKIHPEAIQITLDCGYTHIPEDAKLAAQYLLDQSNEFRDGTSKPSSTYYRAIDRLRRRVI